MITNSTEIKLRLTQTQTILIWPGLDHIVLAFQTRALAGQSLTSFPFGVRQLPVEFDSGAFSSSMMDRILQLRAKLEAKLGSGGRVRMDAFEIRATILSVRTTLKLYRMKKHKTAAQGAQTERGFNLGGIRAPERQIKRFIRSLERQMKRANRRLLSQVSPIQFRVLSKQWQSHLLWMRFRLIYFKPFRPLGAGYRKRQQDIIDRLVGMAKQAMQTERLKPCHERDLRRMIRQFVRYSRRGRQGAKHHRYMLRYSESPFAQAALLQFIQRRINLRKSA